jgi:hypothetical protein
MPLDAPVTIASGRAVIKRSDGDVGEVAIPSLAVARLNEIGRRVDAICATESVLAATSPRRRQATPTVRSAARRLKSRRIPA